MTLPASLEALKEKALQTSCASWAIQKRWKLGKGREMVGPCPKCGGSDRFSINAQKNVFNCRHCGISGEGVIKLVMLTEDVLFVRALEIITGEKPSEDVDDKKLAELREKNARDTEKREREAARYREAARSAGHVVWVSGWRVDFRPGSESVAAAYLRVRGIVLPEEIGRQVMLKEYDRLPWVEEAGRDERGRKQWRTLHTGPALLAAVQQPDGRFGAVHQTWIDLTQPKGKIVLPPDDKGKDRLARKVRGIKQGGAIRLYTPAGARRLVMGEGIETTLTPLAHAREDETAYWAGIDLGNMAGLAMRSETGGQLWDTPDMADVDCWLVPDWVEELVFLADEDGTESHSVEKAWRGLHRAAAWRAGKREVDSTLPPLAVYFVTPRAADSAAGDINDLVLPATSAPHPDPLPDGEREKGQARG